MTVVGFARSRDGSGYCWGDSERYLGAEPLPGSTKKVVVSEGGLVGAGTGYSDLTEQFRRMVAGLGRTSFASAIVRLATQLRRACAEHQAHLESLGLDDDEQNVFALCGFEDRFRGAVFLEGAAVEHEAWSLPDVGFAPPTSAGAVLEIAQRQIARIQRRWPTATGRELTVAKLIGSERVECVSVPLLLDHERPGIGDSPAHRAATRRDRGATVFHMKARRQAAGEWRARQATKTPSAPLIDGRVPSARKTPKTPVERDELIEWLRSTRSTRTVAAAPRWKCGASINLALVDDGEPWDGPAASASIFDAFCLNTPWSDSHLARRGFLAYDSANPRFKSSYALCFARIIDGVLTADREGLEVAARDLACAHDLPDDVRAKARAVVTRYRVGR